MKDKTFLYIGLGVGALLLLQNYGGGGGSTTAPPCSQRLVQLPTGQTVCETQLPALGYILYNGQWFHRSQFQPPPQYGGVNPNSQEWQNILIGLVNTGFNIYNLFSGTGGQSGPTGGGGTTGGGSGGGF